MDCGAYERRVFELEAQLRRSESREALLEGRLKALGQELFAESYSAAAMHSELQVCSRVYASLEAFGSSLAEVKRSRIDPFGIARQAQSWRAILAREVVSVIRCGDAPDNGIERLCDAFRIMEAGLADATLARFVEAAKVDVLVYRFEVYKVFMGLSRNEARDLGDCSPILMDRWDRGAWGKELRARFPDYERLVSFHDLVRDAGIEAVDCFRSGNIDEAFDALDRMETASTAVWTFFDGFALKGEQISSPEGNPWN